jgi:NAD+ kinase
MLDKIRTVAILNKINSVEAETAAKKIAQLLQDSKVSTMVVEPLQIRGCTSVKADQLRNHKFDLAISIGGDGTTLRAFRVIPPDTPLMSMNIGGHRGILSEVDAPLFETALKSLLAGKCFIESRIRIQASVEGVSFPSALNDILITRMNLTRTPVLTIKLMGDEIRHRMDGLVISTPTGSTGHSFSIGGPVLHEGMNCLILSPIAPVNRLPQLVIPVEEILVTSNHDCQIVIDGQEAFHVLAGKSIKISRYAHDARFLRLKKKGMRQLAKLGF